MNNGQSAALQLSNNQLQTLLTGKFGDGCLHKRTNNKEFCYSTSCIYKDYLEFKKDLLGNLVTDKGIIEDVNRGYKQNVIYKMATHSSILISEIVEQSLEDSLNLMDDLGLALWFYDDGSLHKDKYFYNLNTQKYSEEINRDLFVPFLKDKFDIKATPTIERKKDGREFWYLRIGKWDGSTIISEILSKYPVTSYNYKLWSSETIQKWSKLQEQLKSTNIDIKTLHPRTLTTMLNKISI